MEYSEVPQHDVLTETAGCENKEHYPAKTSTIDCDHRVNVRRPDYLPTSIHSIPFALTPTILPLTYDPHKKESRKRGCYNNLCRCRVIFKSLFLIFLLTVLVHWLVWLFLKKDEGKSLLEFLLER